MENIFARTELLTGSEGLEKLKKAKVAVFGAGGVGGYVIEALARSGVGEIHIVDNDVISPTNINRQIIATLGSVGKYKVDEFEKRIADINPECKVKTYKIFFLPENSGGFDFCYFDYIVDAIDTVTAKIELAVKAQEYRVPIISSMGTGNKFNPLAFKVGDIYETSVCPLAKVMRRELRKRGVKSLKTVYSEEVPSAFVNTEADANKRAVPASIAFVPPVAGLIIASEVVKHILGGVFRS